MPEIRDRSSNRQPAAPVEGSPHLHKRIIRNNKATRNLFIALESDKARVKFGALKALRQVSQLEPQLLYPHFDFFVSMLRSENSIQRWNAMLILGDLARMDRGRKMERILEDYLAPITGPRLIDAANTMRGATAVATAKPHLADKIARAILKVETANYATPECRNVAIGHAITCLDRLVPMVADARVIPLFVTRQLDNGRPATRKKAERFLRRWPLRRSA